jgi:hypothetical protein
LIYMQIEFFFTLQNFTTLNATTSSVTFIIALIFSPLPSPEDSGSCNALFALCRRSSSALEQSP